MKKINLLIIKLVGALLCINGSLHAQNFDWVHTLGGTLDDDGTAVAADASGNVYTMGRFRGTVDFDPGAGVYNLVSTAPLGQYDIFISKLDAAGNFVWAKQLAAHTVNTNAYTPSVALDASGNVICVGLFESTFDVDPGTGVVNMTSTGVGDLFILKLTAAGNFIWAKQIGGSSWQVPSDLAIDQNGNAYVCGYFMGSTDFDPGAGTLTLTSASLSDAAVFIAKYDAAGNMIWAKQIGGTGTMDMAQTLALDGSGNVFVAGTYDGTEDFDPGAGTVNMTTSLSVQTFLLKLSAAGTFIWAKQPGAVSSGTGEVAATTIAADATGNMYYTGSFYGTVDMDPDSTGVFSMSSTGSSSQIFISKLDAAGHFMWAVAQTGDGGPNFSAELVLDASGNVYTSGYYNRTVDFDPGAGVFSFTTDMPGFSEAYISKLSTSGSFIWAKRFTDGNVYAYAMALDPAGDIYITGQLNDYWSVDFDPDTTVVYPVTSAGSMDGYICKLKSESTGITEQNNTAQLVSVYPNPAREVITIRKETNEKAMVSLYSVLGDVLQLQEMEGNVLQLNVESLPAGMYFLRVGNAVRRIEILK